MDEVITCQSINKERLKKIIVDSIYDELNAFFQSSDAICTSKNCIDINRNEISTSVNCDKHSVSRRANDAYFGYVPEKDSYAFSDYDKQLYIKTCDDNNEEILIHYYGSKLKQKITDNNLKKSAKECLVFLKSVSLAELEMYYQTFTKNITQTKEEELPSHETIISAMQKAQKTVEKMRKKEENKEKEDKKEAKEENKEEENKAKEEKKDDNTEIISKDIKKEEEEEENKEDDNNNCKCCGFDLSCLKSCKGIFY